MSSAVPPPGQPGWSPSPASGPPVDGSSSASAVTLRPPADGGMSAPSADPAQRPPGVSASAERAAGPRADPSASEIAASPAEIAATAGRIATAVGVAVVGLGLPLRLILAAIIARGHVLIEDNPGLGKTLLARSLAGALGLDFRRLQFTPDLLPSDVTGSYLYHPGRSEFRFQPGPLFTGLLLADEINRTPPKTQSALLEAMQEGQVSVEGTTHPLPRPFQVIATANQIEFEGTYALPEAQLDRFLIRTRLGYPPPQGEAEMLRRRVARARTDPEVTAVLDGPGLLRLQEGVEHIAVDSDIINYCVGLAVASRNHPAVEAGVSPRGTQALMILARSWAALDGRGFVVPEDVKQVAVPALAHRLVLGIQAFQTISGEEVVRELLASVPVPPSRHAPQRP